MRSRNTRRVITLRLRILVVGRVKDVSADWLSFSACPQWQRAAPPLSNNDWVEEVRGAGGRIRHLSRKNSVRYFRSLLEARIERMKLLQLFPPGHPGLELPRGRNHILDAVSPFAATHSIKNHVGNRDFAKLVFTSGLEGYCPDQIITGLSAMRRIRNGRMG